MELYGGGFVRSKFVDSDLFGLGMCDARRGGGGGKGGM